MKEEAFERSLIKNEEQRFCLFSVTCKQWMKFVIIIFFIYFFSVIDKKM